MNIERLLSAALSGMSLEATGQEPGFTLTLRKVQTVPISLSSRALCQLSWKRRGRNEFGFAFWDPNESAIGWDSPRHYVTGCASQFTNLVLGPVAPTSPTSLPASRVSALKTSGAVCIGNSLFLIAVFSAVAMIA